MIQNYHDSIAICRVFGLSDFFLHSRAIQSGLKLSTVSMLLNRRLLISQMSSLEFTLRIFMKQHLFMIAALLFTRGLTIKGLSLKVASG
jgi:hypothetical protein